MTFGVDQPAIGVGADGWAFKIIDQVAVGIDLAPSGLIGIEDVAIRQPVQVGKLAQLAGGGVGRRDLVSSGDLSVLDERNRGHLFASIEFAGKDEIMLEQS